MLRGGFAAEAGVVQLGSQLADFCFGLGLQRLRHLRRGFFQQAAHAVGALGDAAEPSRCGGAMGRGNRRAALRRAASLFEMMSSSNHAPQATPPKMASLVRSGMLMRAARMSMVDHGSSGVEDVGTFTCSDLKLWISYTRMLTILRITKAPSNCETTPPTSIFLPRSSVNSSIR